MNILRNRNLFVLFIFMSIYYILLLINYSFILFKNFLKYFGLLAGALTHQFRIYIFESCIRLSIMLHLLWLIFVIFESFDLMIFHQSRFHFYLKIPLMFCFRSLLILFGNIFYSICSLLNFFYSLLYGQKKNIIHKIEKYF